jgi:uncharacterized protein (TIGR02145 family)
MVALFSGEGVENVSVSAQNACGTATSNANSLSVNVVGADVNPKEVDLNPIPFGSGTFKGGQTKFDVAVNGGTNGLLTFRQTDPQYAPRINFSTTNTQTYTFQLPTGVSANEISFEYVESEKGKIIEKIEPAHIEGSNLTSTTFTVTYKSDLNATAANTTENNPFTADIYAIYNNQKVRMRIFIQDDLFCGAKTVEGGWVTFMCHNLGAESWPISQQISYSSSDKDQKVSGYLYEWGRPEDGHQVRTSTTTATLSTSLKPGSSLFITNTNSPYDWLNRGGFSTIQFRSRWGDGVADENYDRRALTVNPSKGDSDPCPLGWKMPSQRQWESILNSYAKSSYISTSNTRDTGEQSPPKSVTSDYPNIWAWQTTGSQGYKIGEALFLPAGGHRNYQDAGLSDTSGSRYWSCSWTTDHTSWGDVFIVEFDGGGPIDVTNHGRLITGNSVRCVSES